MRVLGVIPARGGSKGLPRKNIAPVAGKPLLQWTAESALAARSLTRVVLSTEDAEIASVGRACGLEVTFTRPADLAQDDTPTLAVLQHAVGAVEAGEDAYDAVCLLQPTNPLRGPEVIDACVERLIATGADAVMTVLPVPAEHNPHWVYVPAGDGTLRLATGEDQPIPRRQELPPAYHREGSVYVVLRDVLMERGSLYGDRVIGYELDPSHSVNIDEADDLVRAAAMLEGAR